MPLPNWNGEKTTAIAGTILGAMIVLVFVAATLPVGLTKAGSIANEFDSFQTEPLAMPQPVAWWKLDEISGTTVADSSGNANTGTISGGVTLGQPGIDGTAMLFDGLTGKVTVPTSPSLESFTTEVSVSVWFNLVSYSDTNPHLVNKNLDTGLEGFVVNTRSLCSPASPCNPGLATSPGPLSTSIGKVSGANPNQAVQGPSNALGAWHNGVMTFDGSVLRLYQDGVAVGTPQTISQFDLTTTSSLVLGGRLSDNLRQTNAYIDDVRIYSEALTPQQVQELYDPGSQIVPAGSSHSLSAAFTLPIVIVLLSSMVFVGLSYFRSRGT